MNPYPYSNPNIRLIIIDTTKNKFFTIFRFISIFVVLLLIVYLVLIFVLRFSLYDLQYWKYSLSLGRTDSINSTISDLVYPVEISTFNQKANYTYENQSVLWKDKIKTFPNDKLVSVRLNGMYDVNIDVQPIILSGNQPLFILSDSKIVHFTYHNTHENYMSR